MASEHWQKIRYYRYFFHIVLGNSFGRRGPFANTDQSKLSRCKRVVILTYSGITSHLGLLLILITYAFVGAAIFQAIEGSTGRESDKYLMTQKMEIVIGKLRDDLITSGLVENQNETDLQRVLESYFDEYQTWLQDNTMLFSFPSANKIWTFWGSMYFCATAFTTIGYGNLFPVTTLGRWMTVVYAMFGIPIFLITVADLGLLLTRILKTVYFWASAKCCKKASQDDRLFTHTNNLKRNSVAHTSRRVSNSASIPGANDGTIPRTATQSRAPATGTIQHTVVKDEKNSAHSTASLEIHTQTLVAIDEEAHTQHTALKHAKGFINATATEAKLDNLVIKDDVFNDVVAQKLNETPQERVPVYIPVLITLLYALGVTAVLMRLESWTFTTAFYFVFISFSTIGFGDITPHHQNYFLAASVLVLIGLVLVAMVINVLIQLTNETLGMAKTKVDAIAEKKLGVNLSESKKSAQVSTAISRT